VPSGTAVPVHISSPCPCSIPPASVLRSCIAPIPTGGSAWIDGSERGGHGGHGRIELRSGTIKIIPERIQLANLLRKNIGSVPPASILRPCNAPIPSNGNAWIDGCERGGISSVHIALHLWPVYKDVLGKFVGTPAVANVTAGVRGNSVGIRLIGHTSNYQLPDTVRPKHFSQNNTVVDHRLPFLWFKRKAGVSPHLKKVKRFFLKNLRAFPRNLSGNRRNIQAGGI
jgi:hypothetical protein